MVEIEFTYDYDPKFLPIYRSMLESEFTGRDWFDRIRYIPDNVLAYKLQSVLLNRRINSHEMKMMVIYQDGIPVGLSFPKKSFTDSEKETFNLDGDGWYKIGSIVVLDSYRNKGIAYKACKEFLKRYPKIFYHVDEKNVPSVRVAEKLKLNFSHIATLNGINYKVYKSV